MHTYIHAYIHITIYTYMVAAVLVFEHCIWAISAPPPPLLPSSTHILPLQGPEFDPHGLSLSLVFTEFLIHLKNQKNDNKTFYP